MSILIALLIGAGIGSLVGVFAGWLARGREEVEVTVEKLVTQTVEKIIERPADENSPSRAQAAEILAQLQLLTAGVSEKIGAHARTVGDINEELNVAAAGDVGAVLTAVGRLIASNTEMQQQLESAQDRLNEQASQLNTHREEARTDPLTNLRNRRAFDDELQRRMTDFQQRGQVVQLMLTDVDHFKKFNDTYGHLAGDEVLRVVGKLLNKQTAENADLFIARYGGEEFAILMSCATLEAAALEGDRIRALLGSTTVPFEKQRLKVTASAGMAQLATGESVASFIARADEGLYAAKKSGRNCTCLQNGQGVSKVATHAAELAKAAKEANEIDSPSNFGKSLARRIAEWRRGGVPLSLVVMRIDNTAKVEARLGRAGVDAARNEVASLLQGTLRDMDQVANLAGETFGLLLPTCRLDDAARIAERIRGATDSPELATALGLHITASFGVAEVNSDDDEDTLLSRARRAMEAARRRGGNKVFINDGVNSDPAEERLDLVAGKD
jgi:diguanylate cyclase